MADAELSRIVLFVSYDGTHYSGFAQQDNAVTIGGRLQAAIRQIDPDATRVTCSSRTDRGVHARNHPVSFATRMRLPPRAWVLSLQAKLPADICVVRAARVPLDFDPRRDPVFKRYRYRVYKSPVEDPFLGRTCWRVGNSLDIGTMQEEARSLIGLHDFAAFRSADDIRSQTERLVSECRVEQKCSGGARVDIVVQGNRFMYNMVRIIAGTLVDVGRGRLAAGACVRALHSRNRRDLGMTAPPQGLMLEHVELASPGVEPWPPEWPVVDVHEE